MIFGRQSLPFGMLMRLHKSNEANLAHYKEMQKNANNMRKFLMHIARDMDGLTTTFSNNPNSSYQITADRMHAADLFEAVVRALSGERIFINFPAGDQYRDTHGNPCFICPENPRSAELHSWLDQYVDEGNALRKRIAELIGVNVFVRVVYTQKSAILALEELMSLRKMI